MGGGTPLSTRWAQMDQQRRELERRKQLYLQRQQHQVTASPTSSQNVTADSSNTPSLNAFSNDGSFLDKFKQLSGNKVAPKLLKANKLFPKQDSSKKNDKSEKESKTSHQDKHKRDSNYHHNRDRSRSSSRGRDKKHDRKFKNDKNNFRDHKYNRWESNNRGSRRRSFSPCTPVVEDMPHRKSSRFANILPSNVPKNTSFPNTVTAPNLANNLNNYQQHPNPQINLPSFPDQVLSVPKQINLNLTPLTNPIINVQVPPPITVPPPNVIPINNNPNFNNQMIPPNLPSSNQNNIHYPPYNENIALNNTFLPPPNLPNPLFNLGNTAVPPPILNDRIPHLPPPITNLDNLIPHIPLHAIPEPKPIDMISIPPPKPLDTIAIPPPKPLDAVTIPPPKPMNLHTIPPPLPICLTQIPKPKELDLHSIPHPPMSVLSTDGCLSATMEATAKQVAQNGDAWELTLKAQSAKADMWFLHNTKSDEYKMFRNLVLKYRNENTLKNDENESNDDKYEPEFSLRDDSSSEDEKVDDKPTNKENQSCSTTYPIRLHFEKSRNEQKDLSALNKFKNDLENDSDSDTSEKKKKKDSGKKKKSRWGDSTPQPVINVGLPGVANVTNLGGVINVNHVPTLPSKVQPQLTKITRQDPGLLQYAIKTYGSVNLDEEDWKKCEDHYKISILYQEMLTKRREIEKLTASGRFKYEYDSDEEIDENGTWEHRLRQQEMEATQRWACELTRQASGKHHIGDFLPPDELKKFMEKYSSAKSGKEPDLSDYKEYKLKEDNIGFKMLQKLGWSEGEGLGADRSGIIDPVNKATQRDSNHGLGVERADNVSEGDDEFDAYRKRMMLAYRFRPNPLNNPRRPYY